MAPDGTTRTLHEAAKLELRDQRYADAARNLERAIAHDPTDAWAHDKLGIAFQRLGRTDEALKEFERSVELAPSEAVYLYNYGAMLASMGQTDDGISVLQRCLKQDPDHCRAKELLDKTLQTQTN
jgi:Tfp pilus assembly protein PilF